MQPQRNRVIADMSQLLWQARIYNYSALEVQRQFDALRAEHLRQARFDERAAISDELELWAGRIAQLLHPAFLEQAI